MKKKKEDRWDRMRPAHKIWKFGVDKKPYIELLAEAYPN